MVVNQQPDVLYFCCIYAPKSASDSLRDISLGGAPRWPISLPKRENRAAVFHVSYLMIPLKLRFVRTALQQVRGKREVVDYSGAGTVGARVRYARCGSGGAEYGGSSDYADMRDAGCGDAGMRGAVGGVYGGE